MLKFCPGNSRPETHSRNALKNPSSFFVFPILWDKQKLSSTVASQLFFFPEESPGILERRDRNAFLGGFSFRGGSE